MNASFLKISALQLENRALKEKLLAFQSGARYVRMKEDYETIIRSKDRRIRELEKELEKKHRENRNTIEIWTQANEDTYLEEEQQSFTDGEYTVVEGGSYTTKEEVALYIYTYGGLPANFITKSEARDLGWENKEGNLQEVAPGMSIGGDRYGNYEQLLPDGKYKECDINYHGGYRGDERLVYSEDGYIYYTDDHYESFTQLYPETE